MRRVWPAPADDVDPADLYGVPLDAERWVRVNMIASVDGATAVAGKSGALGGPADRELFLLLRSLADVVVVGAGTVRSEGYGPVRLPDALMAAREADGRRPVPRLAIFTRSGRLDRSSPVFATDPPPLVLTGEDADSLGRAVTGLAEEGLRSILVEGGPTINGQLVAAGVVDDLCLTVSPSLVGGVSSRILAGPDLPDGPVPLRLAHLAEDRGLLFSRWLPA